MQEITLQMLSKAGELGRAHGHRVVATLLCARSDGLVGALEGRADEIVVYEDDRLEHFDPDAYADVLGAFLAERSPLLVLLGHTAWSMDLAPALAVRTGHPLATDCVDVLLDGPAVKVVRQVYSGKMFARSAFRSAGSYLVTVRPGSFPVGTTSGRQTTITPTTSWSAISELANGSPAFAIPAGEGWTSPRRTCWCPWGEESATRRTSNRPAKWLPCLGAPFPARAR